MKYNPDNLNVPIRAINAVELQSLIMQEYLIEDTPWEIKLVRMREAQFFTRY